MHDFILNAIIGGVGVAILAGLIGSFTLWKKMSYFGDSLSHATLLGITFSIFLDIDPIIGSLLIALIFSVVLFCLKNYYESDTILGILSQGGLALAIVLLSFMHNVRVDLIGYLFGDILTINSHDLMLIYGFLIIELIWIITHWRSLIIYCIDEDIAQSLRINTKYQEIIFTLMLSMIVVVSIKIVGILLITSLLIIPSAASRNISNTPIKMVVFSICIGIISVCTGLYFSFHFDTPSGPTIILSSLLIFLFSLLFRRLSSS